MHEEMNYDYPRQTQEAYLDPPLPQINLVSTPRPCDKVQYELIHTRKMWEIVPSKTRKLWLERERLTNK